MQRSLHNTKPNRGLAENEMEKDLTRPACCTTASKICFFLLLVVYVGIRWSPSPHSVFPFSSWRVAIWHENDTTSGESIGILKEDMDSLMPSQRLVRGEQRKELDTTGISCFQGKTSDICVMKRNVRIDKGRMTLHLLPEELPPTHQIICPYAVKYNTCLEGVTPVEVLATPNNGRPPCQVTHHVPAIVFSSGSFATNLYHDFNDILIPLFLTSRNFRSQLKFVVTDFQPSWVRKYSPILTQLSAYDPIDAANDGRVHCFPGAVVGLKYHKDFTCNVSEIPGGYSMQDFRRFLHESFHLEEKSRAEDQKPTLVLISRTHSRQILNEDEVVRMEKVLGFHVTVASPQRVANLQKFAQVVHTCDVLVGVHGAGIANMLFMAEGAVLVQVVPLGLNWPSKYYYGEPSRAMGLHYLEYRAAYNESSLSETYPPDHQVIVDPGFTFLQGYMYARAIYLDWQNLRIDLSRFRETLLQAMHKVRPSTERGGLRQTSQ